MDAPSGGGGGTTVTANPGGTPATELTTVTIGTTNYTIPQFDIHDDVTTGLATPGTADRFIVSDESVAGDPMRYVQYVDMRTAIRPAFYEGATLISSAGATIRFDEDDFNLVNNGANLVDIELAVSSGGTASDFVDLGDTPSSITADRVVLGNGAGDALIFGQVDTAQIAAGAVTGAKIGTNEVKTANINGDAVTTNKLAANAVTNVKVADDAIDTDQIANGAVETAQIAANAVTHGKVHSDVIDANPGGTGLTALEHGHDTWHGLCGWCRSRYVLCPR